MDYLVTMTTQVPEGTAEQAVDEVKAREAAHSADLAAQGYLRRLWRPPLRPGEWRTLGLFTAGSAAELEEVLASMPLRIWRTDEVTSLGPHANDPGLPGRAPLRIEFLITMTITMTITVADRVPEATVAQAEEREATRARELAGQGHLMRLWALPAGQGESRALGLWSADDQVALQAVLQSLPLSDWMTIQTIPLSPHPSDPAGPGQDAAVG
jgi:muconolactone delta-isomerase